VLLVGRKLGLQTRTRPPMTQDTTGDVRVLTHG
jgi:hypothetical protein